ncbi:MAG: NAD(P)H-dependent oxidoreductase [Gammaproteobacteria bacterium]|nr:NAD(P)H-dependent oxidoreductase [Gammaproteobacteria bacterium]
MTTKTQNTDLLVVGICGSLRKDSYTRMALKVALEGAQEFGVKTDLIDLRGYNLVFCDGNQDENAYPEDVHKLRSEVAAAQGIILGTPNYHASFSGVLKNALDLMGFEAFEGKMVGLVGVSGGSKGAADALNSLRAIGRALHAWVAPNQISIAEAWKYFDHAGHLKDAGLENRIKEVGRQVARFAYLHSSEKVQEFLEEWERAPENPGG